MSRLTAQGIHKSHKHTRDDLEPFQFRSFAFWPPLLTMGFFCVLIFYLAQCRVFYFSRAVVYWALLGM